MRARQLARRGWREYTRMRTAIFMLIGIVAIVAVGSFVPQQGTSDPTKVQQFLSDHANLNGLFSDLGLPLTSVFVSPLFYVLLASLFIALGACVIRRGRALLVRTLKRYPRTPQYWGEWGSWLFHSSFFMLLTAVLLGKATGFQGIVTVPEGQAFTETRAGYDQLQEGLLFNGHHAGFTMRLNRFTATYAANGEASDYVSEVSVVDHNRRVLTRDIRVNDYLGYDGVAVYQQDYGWAPRIQVRNPAGAVVYDGTVELFGTDKSQQTGVLKVPDFDYTIPGGSVPLQVGARLAFFPDAKVVPQLDATGGIDPALTAYGPGGPEKRNPVLEVQLFVGDLGLNAGQPQDVNQLDTDRMQPYFADAHTVALSLGQALPLPLPGADGKSVQFSLSFPDLKQYSLFLVKQDGGVGFVYASFVLILTGLLVKLYARPLLDRRRRRTAKGPIQLDPRWTSAVSGEPQDARGDQDPPSYSPHSGVSSGEMNSPSLTGQSRVG
jgi:cytochrome c biogenesis protein